MTPALDTPMYREPVEFRAVDERTTGARFENAIREYGIVAACEWFGHRSDSEFTEETIRVLAERAAEANATKRATLTPVECIRLWCESRNLPAPSTGDCMALVSLMFPTVPTADLYRSMEASS